MKAYLLLNIAKAETRYIVSDDIPNLKAHMHQIGYKESDSILCKLDGTLYKPVARVSLPYILVYDFMNNIERYMAKYNQAKKALPSNFPHNYHLI